MPENDVDALADYLDNDLTPEGTEALFELIAGLDPLDMEDGKPKYTPAQQSVIGQMQRTYADAGYIAD